MAKTSIQWADHSINPFRARNLETGAVGHFCVKISPGCKFCYASKMQNPYLTQLEYVAENRSKVELFLEEKALEEVIRRRKPTRYFWCDMTDALLEDYPDEWIDRCFGAMALTPQHTHMVLTKRHERLLMWSTRKFLAGDVQVHANDLRDRYKIPCAAVIQGNAMTMSLEEKLGVIDCEPWPLPNVHLGVSVEDQQHADERIPLLLKTPAAVRFLSVEPLLGLVDLTRLRPAGCSGWIDAIGRREHRGPSVFHVETGLDWVIVGGESGPGARPMDIAWVRSIRDQCRAALVPFFFKQWGEHAPVSGCAYHIAPPMQRVGKKKAGRILDGRTWDEIPEGVIRESI